MLGGQGLRLLRPCWHNVGYCKFSFSENAITDWGLWQQLWMAPYCKKDSNVYMYSPTEKQLFLLLLL